VACLEELGAAQVKHELRIELKVGRQAEAAGVVLSVVAKLHEMSIVLDISITFNLGTEADEHAVKPAEHIWPLVGCRLQHTDASHERRGCLCF
jgi:hypothetical protein